VRPRQVPGRARKRVEAAVPRLPEPEAGAPRLPPLWVVQERRVACRAAPASRAARAGRRAPVRENLGEGPRQLAFVQACTAALARLIKGLTRSLLGFLSGETVTRACHQVARHGQGLEVRFVAEAGRRGRVGVPERLRRPAPQPCRHAASVSRPAPAARAAWRQAPWRPVHGAPHYL